MTSSVWLAATRKSSSTACLTRKLISNKSYYKKFQMLMITTLYPQGAFTKRQRLRTFYRLFNMTYLSRCQVVTNWTTKTRADHSQHSTDLAKCQLNLSVY
jgi:hypothetical protein